MLFVSQQVDVDYSKISVLSAGAYSGNTRYNLVHFVLQRVLIFSDHWTCFPFFSALVDGHRSTKTTSYVHLLHRNSAVTNSRNQVRFLFVSMFIIKHVAT